MEISDIRNWASDDIRTVEITHGFGGAKFKLQLRQFVPEGEDNLRKYWTHDAMTKYHDIAPYAMYDIPSAVNELRSYVDRSVGQFILGQIGPGEEADLLLWDTYCTAFFLAGNASVSSLNTHM